MSFFENIRLSYGDDTRQLMSALLKSHRKLASTEMEVKFLQRCKKFGLWPRSFNFDLKFLAYGLTATLKHRLFCSVRSMVMNYRIKSLFGKASFLARQNSEMLDDLQSCIPSEIYNAFVTSLQGACEDQLERVKLELQQKFDTIWNVAYDTYTRRSSRTDKWFKNLSSVEVPTNVSNILALGDKFAIPGDMDKRNSIDMIANIEATIAGLPTNEKTTIRNKVANILTNARQMQSTRNVQNEFLQKDIKETRQFCKAHPELIIAKADKGNLTVIADKSDYVNKMTELFSDDTTYETAAPIVRAGNGRDVDLTLDVQRKINNYITRLEPYITKSVAGTLRANNTTLGRAYGLYKVHKQGYPLRPIVACVNTAVYNLSKYFSDIIHNVIGKTERYVKNSLDLKESLKEVRLPRNHILVSLDVKSLFTNVPKELVILVIRKKWEDEIKPHTKIKDLEVFLEGLNLVFDNIFFTFNGLRWVHQIHRLLLTWCWSC